MWKVKCEVSSGILQELDNGERVAGPNDVLREALTKLDCSLRILESHTENLR